MPNCVIVVTPDVEKSHAVMAAWERCGVGGATLLDSMGLYKMRQMSGQRDDLPLFPSLRHFLQGGEVHHRTAFAVVDDDFDLDRLFAETEAAVGGDFMAPHSGFMFVMPVTRVAGLRSRT